MDSSGKTKTLVAEIEHSVVGADEDVSQNPQGAWGRGDVDSHESRQALSLSEGGNLEDVLLGGEGVGDAVDDDLNVGQGADDVARGEDTLSVQGDSTEFGVEGVDLGCKFVSIKRRESGDAYQWVQQ